MIARNKTPYKENSTAAPKLTVLNKLSTSGNTSIDIKQTLNISNTCTSTCHGMKSSA